MGIVTNTEEPVTIHNNQAFIAYTKDLKYHEKNQTYWYQIQLCQGNHITSWSYFTECEYTSNVG